MDSAISSSSCFMCLSLWEQEFIFQEIKSMVYLVKLKWVKYIKQLGVDEKLLNIYRELREEFQNEGWSENDLERPPYYTKRIMQLYEAFGEERRKLGMEINSFFGNIELSEYMDYIEDRMRQINDDTPLNKKED